MKTLLPYEVLGFRICAEAKNGQEGLEVIRAHRPDIVKVDITMPVMDGLEMIGTLRKEEDHTKFIILTGYEEFQFARTAVNLGVDQYLIKPVDPEEFRNALLKIKQEVESETERVKYLQTLQCKVEEMSPLVTTDFLSKLFDGDLFLNHAEIRDKLLSLQLNVASEGYFVAAFSALQENETESFVRGINFCDSVKEALTDVLSNCYTFFSYPARNNNVIAVFSEATFENRAEIIGKLEIAIDILFSKGFKTTVGISEIFHDLSNCSRGVQQALFTVKNNVIYGNQPIIYYKNVSCRYSEGFILTTEIKSRLLMALRASNSDVITELLDLIFSEFEKTPINANIKD
jgi:two-component system response regulator YesN